MLDTEPAPGLKWISTSEEGAGAANTATVQAFRKLIRDKDKSAVRASLHQWAPEDIIQLLVNLPVKAARKLLDILPDKTSTRVLSELRPSYRAAITQDKTIERLRDLILGMSPESAFETFQDLPDDVQDCLAPDLKKFERIQASRAFDRESAGEIMQRHLVALQPERSAAEAVAALQSASDMIGSVDTVFVIDSQDRPIGAFKPRALLLAHPSTPLKRHHGGRLPDCVRLYGSGGGRPGGQGKRVQEPPRRRPGPAPDRTDHNENA